MRLDALAVAELAPAVPTLRTLVLGAGLDALPSSLGRVAGVTRLDSSFPSPEARSSQLGCPFHPGASGSWLSCSSSPLGAHSMRLGCSSMPEAASGELHGYGSSRPQACGTYNLQVLPAGQAHPGLTVITGAPCACAPRRAPAPRRPPRPAQRHVSLSELPHLRAFDERWRYSAAELLALRWEAGGGNGPGCAGASGRGVSMAGLPDALMRTGGMHADV